MRVLFTTPPLYGHFHPLVPYGQALNDAGHDVAFAVPEEFRTTVDNVGLRSFPAGSFESANQSLVLERIESVGQDLPTLAPSLAIFRKLFIEDHTPKMVRDLNDLFISWKPDVIVRDAREFGGAIAGETHGIPHVTAGASVFRGPEWWREATAEPLNQIRLAENLPDDSRMDMLYRYLDLVSMPPMLITDQDYVGPTAHFVRPLAFDQSGDEALPAWFDELPEGPLVYGTLGTTAMTQLPGLFEAMAGAMAHAPYTAIITVGRDRDPAEIAPDADNVHTVQYIPQSLLLPHCDAVFCHGGFSSTLAALLHGLPLVIMPLGADQFENAERATQIGAAEGIDPDERNSQRIRQAIGTVLKTSRYRDNAERFRDEVQELPGLDYAVELLERLARERRPIIRT